MKTVCLISALLLLGAASQSCSVLQRSRRQPTPAAKPAPRQVTIPEPPKQVERAEIPPPPELEPQEPDPNTALLFAPPVLQPPARRRVARSLPRQREPEELEQPSAEPNVQGIPQLGQMLSPEQQQAYQQAIDRNLGRAQQNLVQLKQRRLSPEQTTYRDRIITFIQQAEDARKSDLVRAKNLSERATILADDLLKNAQ